MELADGKRFLHKPLWCGGSAEGGGAGERGAVLGPQFPTRTSPQIRWRGTASWCVDHMTTLLAADSLLPSSSPTSVHHCPILPLLISTLPPTNPPPPSQSPLLLTRLSDSSQWEAVATATRAIREAVFMLSHSGAGSSAVMSARTHTCAHVSTHAHTREGWRENG